MGGRMQHVQTKEAQVINTDHGCSLRSTLGSPSVPLTNSSGLCWAFYHGTRKRCAPSEEVALLVYMFVDSCSSFGNSNFGLDTNSFLNAFTGKTSQRGVPKEMIGDCGMNFVGAVSELKELVSKLVRTRSSRTQLIKV